MMSRLGRKKMFDTLESLFTDRLKPDKVSYINTGFPCLTSGMLA